MSGGTPRRWVACQNCGPRSWVYLDSGLRKCKYCGNNFQPPTGWLPKRGRGKGRDAGIAGGAAAPAPPQVDLFKYCQHRYGASGASMPQQPQAEEQPPDVPTQSKTVDEDKLQQHISSLEKYIAMADAVTDELVPDHAQNIADSKQKLAQLMAQAATHLPHHDQ
eukprot:9472399-Pyramimonas_sp.AAC.1